jgi:THO complex subunit 4
MDRSLDEIIAEDTVRLQRVKKPIECTADKSLSQRNHGRTSEGGGGGAPRRRNNPGRRHERDGVRKVCRNTLETEAALQSHIGMAVTLI